MKYDFTSIMDRHNRDAVAVDGIGSGGAAPEKPDPGFDVIPMWVADMNFPTAPSILSALCERIGHPAFGYFEPSAAYYDAIIRWQEKRHGFTGLQKDFIGYENGVLGGVVSALNVMCSKGDNVLLHAPTYIGFTGVLRNNGYHIVHSPLLRDGEGVWRMDLKDMEEKILSHKIHVAIFCSPHNPCGRVWERWELEAAYDLFKKHDVQVVSDEIWSDLIMPGHTHLPSLMVSEDAAMRTVSLYAPSKTFNLAGLVGSYHIIPNRKLRERILKESSLCHYNDMNVLSMHALIGAYSEQGEEWLVELREVLYQNVRYAVDFIREHFEGVSVFEPEGTYMLFLDCEQWCKKHGRSLRELERSCWRVGVALQDGAMFNGPYSLRINLALPQSRVKEAMERLQKYVFTK